MNVSDTIALSAGFFGGYAARYGAAISFGFGLPLITAGWQNIYRGLDGDIDYSWPIAMIEPESPAVTEYELPDQDLAPGAVMHYVRTVLSDCGKESEPGPAAIVRIGGDGEMLPPLPNEPFDVTLEAAAAGKLRVRWKYTAEGEEAAVAGWRIYMAEDGEAFDFETPAAELRADLRTWLSGSLTHGVTYKACVRAITADEDETINTDYATATADSEGPDGLTAVTTSYVEVAE